MDVSCVLCEASLALRSEKKMRKRSFGPSAKSAREVLTAELVATHGLQLKDFISCGTADCFLCKKCDSKLSSIEELNIQLSAVKNEIKPYLENFRRLLVHSMQLGGKRPASSNAISTSTASKHPCLEAHFLESSAHKSPAVSV